jgi:uncharacterized repeat protein (TIGR01451 family)
MRHSGTIVTIFLRLIVLALPLLVAGTSGVQARSVGTVQGTVVASAPHALQLALSEFAAGLSQPVSVTNAGGDRLFVVEKAGRIRIVRPNGAVDPTPYLDITDRVDDSGNEMGFLGLAFHPDYASNGYFYVNYTTTAEGPRRTRISRFSVGASPNVADPASEDVLLTVDQPAANHNAGDIHFGPDGYLYIPLGDGGDSSTAQNMGLLLGKVSRIDVDSASGSAADCYGIGSGDYTVPGSNPFVDGAGGSCDEIWAVGFRNPWRSSFDRATGDLYLGDVGQNQWEEIDVHPAGSPGGQNDGWPCYEGDHEYNTTGCAPISNYTFPIFEYSHSEGCAVIGGYLYRGTAYPPMVGRYLLADYCSGHFWDLAHVDDGWQATQHASLGASGTAAFGEGVNGELYVANIGQGVLYQVQETSAVPYLSIDKQAPGTAVVGDPITYTLTVANSGNVAASGLVVTDRIPVDATYLPGSGGTRVGDVISWTFPSLASGGSVTRTFAVTADSSIVNDDYRVSADGGYSALGRAVHTILAQARAYLPIVFKHQ